jgi:hypothetical protein
MFEGSNKRRPVQKINVREAEPWMRVPKRAKTLIGQSEALVALPGPRFVSGIRTDRFKELGQNTMFNLQEKEKQPMVSGLSMNP